MLKYIFESKSEFQCIFLCYSEAAAHERRFNQGNFLTLTGIHALLVLLLSTGYFGEERTRGFHILQHVLLPGLISAVTCPFDIKKHVNKFS